MNVIFDFLPGLTAALSIIAAGFALLQLVWRHAAEAHMRDLIQMSGRVKKLRARVDAAHKTGAVTPKFYAEVSGELEEIAKQLKAHERAMVLRSLRQPSVTGRQRYVGKLLRAA